MPNRRSGFTLIELLVVVSIVALLISILLPILGRSRELARRAICSSNMRQAALGMTMYAEDRDTRLPASTLAGGFFEQLLWMPAHTYTSLLTYLEGSYAPVSCPNFLGGNFFSVGTFTDSFVPYYDSYWDAYHLGFFFMGGHSSPWPGVPWQSPQRTTDSPSLVFFGDITERMVVAFTTTVPHTGRGWATGPIGSYPQSLGAEGTNVGYLDGSVRWQPVDSWVEYPSTIDNLHRGYW